MGKEFRIYKPRKSNDGAASSFQISEKKQEKWTDHFLFMTLAKQTGTDANGNSSFDWKDGRIIVKLEQNDIGEFLACLNGQKNSIGAKDKGLYHQTPKGNTVVSFVFNNGKDDSEAYYSLRVSSKMKDQKEARVISHLITLAEANALKVLMERALVKKFGW